jgi:hypothetical protein
VERMRSGCAWSATQRDTAPGLRLLHVLDRGEMTVDQRRIGERPEVLSRLQFWGIGREEWR